MFLSASPDAAARPALEVASIFRQYCPEYRATHRLPLTHLKVMSAIEQCRTAALGGHVDECNSCGHLQISYNSCRNRHCPKCQGKERQRWVEAQQAAVLPIEYYHVVFTLPEEINKLARWNQRFIYELLFRAAAQTLCEFGERHLGGEIGVTAVLHTWGQQMQEHIHLHCIVTGGALATDGSRWQSCRRGFLFPTRALAAVFRGKYCASLEKAYAQGKLQLGGALVGLAVVDEFRRFMRRLVRHKWVVYAKRPFAGPTQVLSYIGRYTHRVAISNRRITEIADGWVTFEYKDYRDGAKRKLLGLRAAGFIRRFLLHVLPAGFVRIRHYGLLANGRRQQKIARCRELLAVSKPDRAEVSLGAAQKTEGAVAPEEARRCPQCQSGVMERIIEVRGGHGPPRWSVVKREAA